MKKTTALVIVIILIAVSVSIAQTMRKTGSSAAQFLKIGVGARAVALAGAFGAISNDATALYWNPAGIANVPKISWTGSHADWMADISHQFSGLVVPLGAGGSSFGLSVIFTSMGEEPITTELAPRGTGYFWDASDVAVGLSYARWMTDRFALGVTAKYVSQKIWNETGATFAVDIGTYLRTKYKGIVIGMCFSNFGGSLQLQGRDLIREYDPNPNNSLNSAIDTRLHTEPWPLPVNFRVGVAMDLIGHGDNLIRSQESRITLAIDGMHPNDDSEKLNFGLEYGWKETLFARCGYGLGYDLANYSYGVGLNFKIGRSIFKFDYALAPLHDLGDVHFFTVGVDF